ncbi:MAG: hypothetical protein ACRD0H_01375, partial [Actinomycetes bacterium]
VGVWLGQGEVPVALGVAVAFFVLVALVLDVAEAVALLVTLPVALPVVVTVLVAGELGLALPLAGLPLELVLPGLVAVVAGGTLGVTDFGGSFDGDGEALGAHAVVVAPARSAEAPA